MSGPTGTGFAPLPSNLRDRRTAGGACPDAFRIRASVESRKEGDATEKRLVVEMLSSDAPMVTWNDFAIAAGGVEADGGLSPAANCNVGLLGWQRIHEGAWEDAEGFVGDIEVWLRLHLTFNPTLDEGYGPAGQGNTGWTLVASAKDDERWTIPSKAGEMGMRELIRYYRVAKVEGGAVTCQDLLGGLHFVEMYPEEGGGGGSGPSGGDEEAWAKKCVTSLTGDKAGSLPVKGAVAVSAARTGLKVGTGVVKEAGEDGSETEVGSMRIEVEGLGSDEAVALRDVKDVASGKTIARVMGTADVKLPAVVTAVNGAAGDVRVIGGENIEVTADGNTIKVSYREGKEPDEPPGADPCAHDGVGGAGGGVSALADGATGGDWGPGGVPAGGDSHPGDDGCNCD